MTKAHGAQFRLYFDEFNISGLANKFGRKVKVDTADVSNFGGGGHKECLEGAYDWNGDFAGFYETGVGSWDEQAFARLANGADHYAGQVIAATKIAGAAAGDICWEDVVRWTDQPRDYDIGGAVLIGGGLQGSGGTAQGLVNYAGAVTATGAKAGVNHGATTTPTMVVVTYRILSASGTGSIAFATEQFTSDTPAAYAAIAALASGTITVTAGVCNTPVVRKTDIATSQAWKRINCTTFTGITTATVLVTITVRQ